MRTRSLGKIEKLCEHENDPFVSKELKQLATTLGIEYESNRQVCDVLLKVEYYDSNQEFDVDVDKINLLSHQKEAIEYLVAKCRKQKGLLVNHYQGTGKTITGIFFAKNYPNAKVVILAPKALKSLWQTAATNNDLKIRRFVSYEELDDIFENNSQDKLFELFELFHNCVLIADEAHNIIKLLDNMYMEASDNLMDEKDPSLSKEDQRRAKNVNKDILTKRINVIDCLEIFKMCQKIMLLTGTPILDNVSDIRWLINIAAGKTVVPFKQQDFEEMFYQVNKINFALKRVIQPLLELYGGDNYNFNFSNQIQYEKNRIYNMIEQHTLLGITGNKPLDYAIRTFLAGTIVKVIKTYYDKFNTEKLDVNKIIKNGDWGKYVSFYKYTNSEFYPSYSIKSNPVLYTNYQLDVWARLNNEIKLTDEEAVLLELNKDITDAQLFKPNYLSNTLYISKGRIIGNLTKDDVPIKFAKIAESYMSETVSTLVYSNFYESGILLLSKYLTSIGIYHKIFQPALTNDEKTKILDDFKEGKLKLVLLHPSLFEGFSINGVRKFHILEPIQKYYVKEQLYTRVIRYRSHMHLPINERHVEIVQWYCTLSNIADIIRQQTTLLKSMKLENLNQFLSTYGGPDDVVFNEVDNNELKLNKLADVLKQISVGNVNMPLNCCIYGDHDCTDLSQCADMPPIDIPQVYQRAKNEEEISADHSEVETDIEISDDHSEEENDTEESDISDIVTQSDHEMDIDSPKKERNEW